MHDEPLLSFRDLVNQLSLESLLSQKFSFDALSNIYPENLWPDFTQGLPRYQDPASSKFLQVKKDFEDSTILFERICEKYLSYLYRNFRLHEKPTVILLTYVVPGGLGDAYFQKFLKSHLQNHLPNLAIRLITFLHETAPLVPLDSKKDFQIRFSEKKELSPLFLPKDLIDEVIKCSLLIEVPAPLPYFEDLVNYCNLSGKTLRMGEYGFIQHELYSPKKEALSFGMHFLEYGLLLKEPKCANLALEPSININISSYYFCYFFTQEAAQIYLIGLASTLKESSNPLIILTPDIGLFLKVIEEKKEWLYLADVGSIEIFYNYCKTTIPVSQSSKKIHLVHAGHLSHKDFLYYLENSQEPVGIRGNLSFSEAIEREKTFFYDPLTHNMPFYYELLAESKKNSRLLERFFKLFVEKKSYEACVSFGELVQEESFIPSFKQWIKEVKAKHLGAPFIQGALMRALSHIQHPLVKKKERELTALFLEEKIDFELLVKGVSSLISSYSSAPQNPS